MEILLTLLAIFGTAFIMGLGFRAAFILSDVALAEVTQC